MKLITTTTFFILTSLFFGQTVKLECAIKADHTIYKKGSVPNITIEIKNNSDSIIQLVKTLDGSSVRWRFPYSYFKIEKIGDTTYKTKTYERCGNIDAIKSADFVEVRPGDNFNPYNQTPVYSDFKIKDSKNFENEGKYKITFYYSTNETRFKKWLGDSYAGQPWFDRRTGNVLPEKESDYNKLLVLFSKVPKLDLISNEITIEIK